MRNYLIICLFSIFRLALYAQDGDDWNNRIIPIYDKDIEIARITLTFTPGFETTTHDDFIGYIDPDLPLNGGTPVADGEFNLNYIIIFEPIKNNITDVIPEHDNIDYEYEWKENITYFDGLGRTIQQTMVKASSYGNDIIVPILYDDLGRKKIEYLPYAIAQDGENGSGGYRPTPDDEIKYYYRSFYGDDDGAFPYADKEFDGSPLNRVLEQSNAGKDWELDAARTIKYDYSTNTSSTEVYKFGVSATNQLMKLGCYSANKLFKNIYKDEDDHITIEYKDFQNRVVAKIVKNGSEDLITQYIYDDFGLLRYVLPPESYSHMPSGSTPQTFELDDDWIQQLCYYYKYDDKKRMAIKKLPGADEIYLIYNKLDQLVLMQDGEQRIDNKWTFTKYDVFNRQIITGIHQYTSAISQKAMQTIVNSATYQIYEEYVDNAGYSNSAYPVITSADEILTLTYYDNYEALQLETYPLDYYFWANDLPFYFLENGTYSTKIKGFPTITKTKVLLHDGLQVTKDWLVSCIYYDKYSRVIQSITDNHVGGITVLSSQINFTGEVEETKEQIIVAAGTNTIQQQFAYNHAGFLIETKHKINNQAWVILNNNKYNETGQLTQKQLHKTQYSFLQTVNNKYNIRGWLTNINDVANRDSDLFAVQLDYNTAENTKQFNGNIGAIKWNSAIFPDMKQYDYSYDYSNRLLSSSFVGTNDYSTSYTYYKNGNIKTLQRIGQTETNSWGVIDDLAYNYNGNQLNYVNDGISTEQQDNGFTDNGSFLTTKEYFYDLNGNLKNDFNKQIFEDIEYNYMNLPQHITIFNNENKYIDYIYSATGQKLQKVVSNGRGEGTTTDYLGNFVYNNTEIDFIFTPDGRIVPNSEGGFDYEYSLTDHLGNTRVSFNQSGVVLQDNSYYPFGMSMGESLTYISDNATENKYKYNGKELQDDFGLNWYDYGARMYDPALGRWHVTDNKAELYFGRSPYIYALNNPINAIDPDGNIVIFINGNHFGSGAKGYLAYAGNSRGVSNGNYNFSGTSDYWSKSGFDGAAMVHLGDDNAMYRDGGIGGFFGLVNGGALTSSGRDSHGYGQGKMDAKTIIAGLERDNAGNIIESIKIITHSMGGAYGKGFVRGLKEYIKTLPESLQKQIGILVSDFDPLMAQYIKADPDIIKTMQYIHDENGNIWGFGWLANYVQQGIEAENVIINNGTSTDHSIASFFDDISSLETGFYYYDGNSWVKQ